MDEYKFNPEHSKMIVDAIVDGYHDYIEHRRDRKSKMKISSAFAWTKGNFIESRLAEESVNHGFTYKKSKAGLTWDYLQFIHGDSKILFLIKNAAYFNENSFSQAKLPNNSDKKARHRTYLQELSTINKNLTFSSLQQSSDKGQQPRVVEQLSFWVIERQVRDELETFTSSYDQFHILTYALDEAYQISEIMHYLPNPADNIAYIIEDLSHLISGAELTDEEREVIAPEMAEDIMDPAAFDIGIFDEEEQQS